MLVRAAPERLDLEPEFRINSILDTNTKRYTKFVAHIGEKIVCEFDASNCKEQIKQFPRYTLCCYCNKAVRKYKSFEIRVGLNKPNVYACQSCYTQINRQLSIYD